METNFDDDLRLKLKANTENYFDSSVYPSNSPINKKSQLNIRLNVDEEQENNGNDLYLNINNQSTLSLKTISNNDTEIFKNNSQFNDNFVNSDEFNDEDIFKVNQETYRVDTQRQNSIQIDKDSLLSVRSENPIITDTIDDSKEDEEEADLILEQDFSIRSISKVNREKSFIIDLYNKANNTKIELKSTSPIKRTAIITPIKTFRLSSATDNKNIEMFDEANSKSINNGTNSHNNHNINNNLHHHNNNNVNMITNQTPPPLNLHEINSDYYAATKTPNPNNKATEDFLDEIRMSNTSMQRPLSSKKKFYSNSPSQKPPHVLPPLSVLNSSKKYMSVNNSNIENDNYDSLFANETYSNDNQNRDNFHNGYNTNLTANQTNDPLVYSGDYQQNNYNQDFDALQSRRRLLHELSSNALKTNTYNAPSGTSLRRNTNQPFGEIGISNNNFTGSIFNETLTSNDMDELIDVMAKRRIAIKKLEIEMNRQHTRASSLLRQSNYDPGNSIDRLRSYDLDSTTISFNPRTSLFQTNTPNELPLSSRIGLPPSSYNTRQTPSVPMVSTLQYPSETNRDIYSTYLSDSMRPHYSAKRLVSGANFTANPMNYNNLSATNNNYNNGLQRSNSQNPKPVNVVPNSNLGYNSSIYSNNNTNFSNNRNNFNNNNTQSYNMMNQYSQSTIQRPSNNNYNNNQDYY